ncbi:hypothetical protein K431DRAFT_126299 [Polychaeton citri CBS 116435]|uniref:MHD domain-containing protein n=1 Tax=Polychaeton citri CBS 116435 TaxID=1314669 RepID=A0A9P4UN96_9PEZI|nr:hypothetical protein K431DRAFT_126299 [Polychaeton citri CBS 116435]
MAMIEAVHIFDEHNKSILSHVYNTSARIPPGSTLLSQYLQHSSPQPSLIYLSSTNPPTLLHSVIQNNLLFLSPSTSETEPLLVLEYLHRVADALEEFLGSPLLASKITANYDIVSQVVAEIADGGLVCQGEANVLRDTVETGPGVLNNLLGGLGLPGASPTLGSGGNTSAGIAALQRQQQAQSSSGSAVAWRRSNVRHTSNELYVDIVEALSVVVAPSGRPLAAFANGSVAFTSKVSGVPDLILNLSTGGKGAGMGDRGEQLRSVMERTVFHPCVRLNRWKNDGTLSFVPPDGRFILVGYEVDLLGPDFPLSTSAKGESLNLPASVELKTGLGDKGSEFEARLTVSGTSSLSAKSAAAASLQSNLSTAGGGGIGGRPGAFRAGSGGDSKAPTFEDLSVRIPLPSGVRKVSELRPSRGDAEFNATDSYIEWKVRSKDLAGPFAGAVLRATVAGSASGDNSEEEGGFNGNPMNGLTTSTYDYDEDTAYPSKPVAASGRAKSSSGTSTPSLRPDKETKRSERYRALMPTSATVSFSVKGWLASGLKVESLLVDSKKSKGLGSEVKPYKGVKYLTVSRQGVEVRC